MIYYKKIGIDGQVMIGKQEVLPTDTIEITEEEYNEKYKEFYEEAKRKVELEMLEFGYLNSEEGGDSVE